MSRSGVGAVVALGLMALVVAGVVSLWMARHGWATGYAVEALAERGVVCDDRFGVVLDVLPGHGRVGPTRCTVDGVAGVSAIEVLDEAEIDIAGTTVEAIRFERLGVELRRAAPRGTSGWSGPLSLIGAEAQAAGLVLSLWALAATELPALEAEHVVVQTGAAPLEVDGVSLADGTLRVARASLAGGVITLEEVEGSATPSDLSFSARAEISAAVAVLYARASQRIRVRVSGLDTERPRFDLSLSD